MIAWPLPMDTLSPSSINKFQRCPEQWRRQYLLGQWEPSSASSVVGNAVHGSAQVNYTQKIGSGMDLSIGDVELAYAEAFDHEVDEAGGPREIQWTMKYGSKRLNLKAGQAKDLGVPLARTYHENVAAKIQPVGSEEWFRVEVPGVPVPVRGKIDLITKNFKTDMKFGASAKKKPEAAWQLQAKTYMLVDATTNRDGSVRVGNIGHLPFSWHTGSWGSDRTDPKVLTPRDEPDLMMMKTEQTVTVAHALIKASADAMVAFYRQFGPDEPWPTSALQHTWACNYCMFNPSRGGNCFWWTGGKETVTL